MMMKHCLILGTLVAVAGSAWGADLYVSPAGDDMNPGTQSSPLASLHAAQKAARKLAGKEAVTVHVADGTYYLPRTLVFQPEDSGSEKAPVVFRAQNEGKAVLSGGTKLNLEWKPFKNNIFQAQVPHGIAIDQLFVNGEKQRMARYPNYDASKKSEIFQGNSSDAISRERAARWRNPKGAFLHAKHSAGWGGVHFLIEGKDSDGEVVYSKGWGNNRGVDLNPKRLALMVENIFEELDAPGEWFHNTETNTLYYMPEAKGDLKHAKVEVDRLSCLVDFRGSMQNPVKHIAFEGFVVRHATRTFMRTREPLMRSDWMIYRGGAFLLTGTEHISIKDCEFDRVGGNAIFVNHYNRHTLVKGCYIHDTGASGVCFVGDPGALHDARYHPLERRYHDPLKLDHTPGPKTQNYPAMGTVEDCLIHSVGRTERQPAGVQIQIAMDITVRDATIYDTVRAGINIGDGSWGGHLIERVDVFDTVLETNDHGSFNSWGRDRYWRRDRKPDAVDANPKLPFLDAVKTTVIRNSRWRCEHGWDIDLDDGASNYDVYNNLMLCGGLKFREGYRRRAWNNVFLNSGLSAHGWFKNNKQDQIFSNIMPSPSGTSDEDGPNWPGVVDRNLYYGPKIKQASLSKAIERHGWDSNSLIGDPLFVDPKNGDFRVKEESPAIEIGFRNFPMDQFGVKKPSLKAIAEAPSFGPKPPRAKAPKTPPRAEPVAWLGATAKTIEGNEFSLYGVAEEDGGVALIKVPESSAAAKAGLKKDDLIQGVNGERVSTTDELFERMRRAGEKPSKLKVVRDQQEMNVMLTGEAN